MQSGAQSGTLRGHSISSMLSRWLIGIALTFAPVSALGQEESEGGRPGAEPSVDDVREAGEEFNRGRAAFKGEEYAVAAEHFERADALAPNAKVLHLAIQSRQMAGQKDRAATLVALAAHRYPDDPAFEDVNDLLEQAESELAKIEVSCDSPCGLVVGTRLIHGRAAKEWVLFLEEGSYTIRAGWGEDRVQSEQVEATAGETTELWFSPPEEQPAAPQPAAPVNEADPFGLEQQPSEQFDTKPRDEEPRDGLEPTWFWVGAGVTGVLLGASIWSGIDTTQNPGADRVRRECVGQGESCPLYQDGVSAQNRTNLLWGVTAGAAIATGVLGLLTDWGPPREEPPEYADPFAWSPWIGVGEGAQVGAVGRF